MPRSLPVFDSIAQMARTASAPQNVRVFESGRFLYASFEHGREQILDIRAYDRLDLLQYWFEWMRPAASTSPRRERTPERSAADEPPGEFLTSLGKPGRARRMTLQEFLMR